MADSRAVDRTLAGARAALTAPASARQRVRAQLDASGAFAGAVTGASGVSGASATPQHGSATGLTRSVGVARSTVAVLVGLGFGAGYWLGMFHDSPGREAPLGVQSVPAAPEAAPREAPRAPAPSAPAADTSAARAETNGAASETLPQVADGSQDGGTDRAAEGAEASSRRASRTPARASRKPGFTEELALLQRAERALRAGEAELALSFVSELERRYPESPFREERGAARVMGECALGRPGATERAAMFLRDRPASVYSDRVRQLCIGHASIGDETREPGH